MKTNKKIHRNIFILGFTLLLGVQLFVSSIFPSAAFAANQAASMSVPQQAQSWWYYNALKTCLTNSAWNYTKGDITAGNWLDNNASAVDKSVYGAFMQDTVSDIGDDNAASCRGNQNEIIKDALSLWDMKALDLICGDAGTLSDDILYRADHQDCYGGSNDFDEVSIEGRTINEGPKWNDRVNTIMGRVTAKVYAGKAPSDLTDPQRYYYYLESFKKGCTDDANAITDRQPTGSQVFTLKEMVNGSMQTVYYIGNKDKGTSIFTWPGGQKMTCENLAKGTITYASSFAALDDTQQADPSSACTGETDASGTCVAATSDSEAVDCGSGVLSWIVCPLVKLTLMGANTLDSFIMQTLNVNTDDIFGRGTSESEGYYKAWNSFRIIATALIVIAGLVMVVSQALGFEFLDAYTIRKTLPRLLVAVIGISLSWPLMEFVVGLFNVIGTDIRQLIYAPFTEIGGLGINTSTGFLTSIAAGGLFLTMGPAALTFVLTALLAALVGFLILVIRQIAIIALIIVAPVAIACYILPNTQKMWDMWRTTFLGLMFMFPIIAALIAAGHVFAVVAVQNDSIVWQAIALVAYIVPYFLLPMAARLAGGLIGTLSGLVNDRGRGMFDRLKGIRSNATAKNLHDMKVGNRFKGDSVGARAFNRTTSGIAAVPHAGVNPLRMGSRMQAAMSRNSIDEAAEFAEKDSAFNAIKSNDDFLLAGLHGQGNDAKVRQYLQGKGYSGAAVEQAVAAVRAARRAGPSEVFDTAAALSLPATGTAFKGGAGEMHDVINEVAGNDRVKAARMLGAMRSAAGSARRFDISGGGFGDELKTLEAQHNGTLTTQEANVLTARQALEGQGGSYIAGARKGAVGNFTKPMLDKLDEAVKSGDRIALASELAKLAGRYDAMSQVAPENAEQIATQVMGQTLGSIQSSPFKDTFTDADSGTAMTVREMIESFRGDTIFLDRRKEWGQATKSGLNQAALAEQQAQQQSQAAGQVQPPINPPPVAPL